VKRCPACGETKPADAFYVSKQTKSGLSGWCKSCSRAKANAKSAANAARSAEMREQRQRLRREQREAERLERVRTTTHKTCRGCKETLAVDKFALNRKGKDGRQDLCKECQRAYARKRRESRPKYEPDPSLTHKRCSTCGDRLPVSQFAFCRTAIDGYQHKCRGCQRAYDQAHYWSEAKKSAGAVESRAENIRTARAKRRLAQMERRVLLREFGIYDISDKDIRRLANSPCAHCGDVGETCVDHIIPVKRGGRHSIGNLQALCLLCNSSKNDRLEIEWKYGRSRPAPLRRAS
jgi:5-methylcytosine-specific restriction endonuclease McrA